MKIGLKVFCLLFIVNMSLLAQNSEKQKVLEAFKKLDIKDLPVDKQSYHIKYKMKVRYQDKDLSPQLLNVEMKVSATQSHFISDYVDFYKDEQDAFTVMKKQRRIIRTDPTYGMLSTEQLEMFEGVKDKLFETARVESLGRSKADQSKSLYKIIPQENLRAQSSVDYMLVELDVKSNKILRIAVFYKETSEYKVVEYVYELLNYDAKLNMKTAVKRFFLNTQNQLKSKFKGFKLIDTRHHSQK